MKYSLPNLALYGMVVLAAGSAYAEPLSKPASGIAAPAPSSHLAGPHDKGPSSNGKEGVTATAVTPQTGQAQVMEKLSNIVSKDYIIGAEDVLEISVWRNQDLSKTVHVRPDGKISLPIVRDVTAVGQTPSQLADEITARLKDYVQNPAVAISVNEVNSYAVFLIGEVTRPGKYPLKSKTTLLQALTIAGGFTPTAARNQLVVFRIGQNGANDQVVKASYDDIVLRGGVNQNIELKAGDTIVVPSEAMVVFPGR